MPFWNRKTDVRLVVGLGNPGEKYTGSRHNVGFMCLDHFAKDHNISFGKSRCQAKVGEGRIAGHDVIFAKPQTYMNNSGESVSALVRRNKVKHENLIVVHDDMDLPVGRVRIRLGGSAGGHKGIKSIAQFLSSEEFVRVRVGIGRPNGTPANADEDAVIGYVLGNFTADETAVIDKVIPVVAEAIDCLLTDGLNTAMNRYNNTDLRK